MRKMVKQAETTVVMLDAIAWGGAPKNVHARHINRRVVCADGFSVSIQASERHYAIDSAGKNPYFEGEPITYPYVSFEIGYPSEPIDPIGPWERDAGPGVWGYVPRRAVEELLVRHGGAVGWEAIN